MLTSLSIKYNTVACIQMLSYVLHTRFKLQGSLEGKDVDEPSVPGMIESTTRTLKRLSNTQTTVLWFKDHCVVFIS